MNLTAATEASATSGWLEGWIGGLIAAAVTLAFTAWWETRRERRRRFEDALLEVGTAADAFWAATTLRGPSESHGEYWQLAKSVRQAQWALTRTLNRWRWLGRLLPPSRRLALAHELEEAWDRLSAAKDPMNSDEQGRIALEISTVVMNWQNDPGSFPRLKPAVREAA